MTVRKNESNSITMERQFYTPEDDDGHSIASLFFHLRVLEMGVDLECHVLGYSANL